MNVVYILYKLPIDLHLALSSAFDYCKFEKLINYSNSEAFNVYLLQDNTAVVCIVVVIEIDT